MSTIAPSFRVAEVTISPNANVWRRGPGIRRPVSGSNSRSFVVASIQVEELLLHSTASEIASVSIALISDLDMSQDG